MIYRLMERDKFKEKVLSNSLPKGTEFFMDIDVDVPQMIAYIWGAENSIIDIDDHLYFAEACIEMVDEYRFSPSKYCIVRYPN